MPNIKSAKKRVEVTKFRTAINRAAKSNLKTDIKKFEAAVAGGNRTEADSVLKYTVKSIDQAVSKGIIHKNNAARKKSGMAVKLNRMGQ